MNALAPYWKAVAGFLAPGIVLFVKDVAADSALPTQHEWLAIGLAMLAGAVGVYAAPKNAPTAKHSQRGAVDLATVLLAVVLVILVLILAGYITH